MDIDFLEVFLFFLEFVVIVCFGCVNLFFYGIVEDWRLKERIFFEVMVLVELFLEMF